MQITYHDGGIFKLKTKLTSIITGDDVKIGDYCKIVGPAFINDNSVIGDYSMIRESQIGQDCLIGSYTEVARSYIGNNVFLHRNYIGDSILDNGVMFGAQAVTGNFRFNGEKVSSLVNENKVDTGMNKLGAMVGGLSKVGVNATILPGVKIGKETLVGPGEIVKHDLNDKIYFSNGKEKINLKI